MIRVLVESPYGHRWFWGRYLNRRYARRCLHDCITRGEAPFASHLLYTQPGVLCDEIPNDRDRGIQAGLLWGVCAEATIVYVDRGVSKGMILGIEDAKARGRQIIYRSLYCPVEVYYDKSPP